MGCDYGPHVDGGIMKQEIYDSATSYSVAGGSLFLAYLMEIASFAQQITIILACMAVCIRLAYDAIKLCRYWKEK